MRTEWKLFIYLAVFMLPLGVIYWILSREEAGALLLVVTSVAFAFVGVYLYMQSKYMNGLRPEDYNAKPEDGTGEVGSFPAGSIYPFLGALGMTMLCYGLVFNGFLALPGVGLIGFAVIGMARESSDATTAHSELNEKANEGAPIPPSDFTDQVKK